MPDPFQLQRRLVIHGAAFVALAPILAARPAGAVEGASPGNFDFLHGRWRVRHRKLRTRLKRASDWFEFPDTLGVNPILGGHGNVDENVLDDPAGRYLATSLRVFDPRAGTWSIYWVDERFPGLGTPVIGRFGGPTGRFYADESFEGRPIAVRFTYEDVRPGHARWAQAFSADGGKRWETNWTMDFERDQGSAG